MIKNSVKQLALLSLLAFATGAKETGLPPSVLAFPGFLQEETPGEVWSQKRLREWAHAQGFAVTKDSPEGGWQFERGLLIQPPGLDFYLYAMRDEKGSFSRVGWDLVLDFGALRPRGGKKIAPAYENILRYEIYINGLHMKTIEMGYGKTVTTPIRLSIPLIRHPEGRVHVEIKLANHPENFAILYDASLVRS